MHWTRAYSASSDRASARRGGLADAGVVLDQHVALSEQGDEDVAHDVVADLDRALDVLPTGPRPPPRRLDRAPEPSPRTHGTKAAQFAVRPARLMGGGRASSGVCRGYATAPASDAPRSRDSWAAGQTRAGGNLAAPRKVEMRPDVHVCASSQKENAIRGILRLPRA